MLRCLELEEILEILENNARIDIEELAEMTGKSKEEVKEIITQLEENGIIMKYKTLINWEKTGKEQVFAIIDVKVNLNRETGYDKIAHRIAKFPEVHSVRLVSGDYDLQVVVKGKNMKEVAFFVAEKISTLPQVTDTNTHFVLRTYKEEGILLFEEETDRRLAISP